MWKERLPLTASVHSVGSAITRILLMSRVRLGQIAAGEYVTFGGSTVSIARALCDTNTYSADVNQLLCATVSCAEDSEFNWVDPTSNDGNCVACDTDIILQVTNTCNSCDAGYGFADGNCTECTDFTFNADDGTTSACAAMSCPVGEGVSDPAGPTSQYMCRLRRCRW